LSALIIYAASHFQIPACATKKLLLLTWSAELRIESDNYSQELCIWCTFCFYYKLFQHCIKFGIIISIFNRDSYL